MSNEPQQPPPDNIGRLELRTGYHWFKLQEPVDSTSICLHFLDPTGVHWAFLEEDPIWPGQRRNGHDAKQAQVKLGCHSIQIRPLWEICHWGHAGTVCGSYCPPPTCFQHWKVWCLWEIMGKYNVYVMKSTISCIIKVTCQQQDPQGPWSIQGLSQCGQTCSHPWCPGPRCKPCMPRAFSGTNLYRGDLSMPRSVITRLPFRPLVKNLETDC